MFLISYRRQGITHQTVKRAMIWHQICMRAEGQEKPNRRTLRAQSKDQGSALFKVGTYLERKGALSKGQLREGMEPS
jgi:hypothetical protein